MVFVSSSGYDGAPPSYPATSPNVLSVGGTALTLGAGNVWSSESGWSGSGGGPSAFESQPSYQQGVVPSSLTSTQRRPRRRLRRIAVDPAWPSTIPSSTKGRRSGRIQVGGTSAVVPQWSALVAIADQGLALLAKLPAL